MPYQPGIGISYTAALAVSDVGNVPNPERVRKPEGTPGRMNGGAPEGTIYYTPKPDPEDIEQLADLCDVGARTVERWFGVPDLNDRVQFRNCVPLRSSNFSTVAGAVGRRLCSMSYETRRRCILAACLSVKGGIYRVPLYTYGNKDDGGAPFVMSTGWDTLAECIEDIEQLIDGDTDYILMVGWVQITIEVAVGGGWAVTVYHFYPQGNEYKEKTVETECPGGM